jgi:hypothetical protein
LRARRPAPDPDRRRGAVRRAGAVPCRAAAAAGRPRGGDQRAPRRRLADKPPRHSGAWGAANLDVCRAILASSAAGREIMLGETA